MRQGLTNTLENYTNKHSDKNETQMGKLTPSIGKLQGEVTVGTQSELLVVRTIGAQTVLGQIVQYTFKGLNSKYAKWKLLTTYRRPILFTNNL